MQQVSEKVVEVSRAATHCAAFLALYSSHRSDRCAVRTGSCRRADGDGVRERAEFCSGSFRPAGENWRIVAKSAAQCPLLPSAGGAFASAENIRFPERFVHRFAGATNSHFPPSCCSLRSRSAAFTTQRIFLKASVGVGHLVVRGKVEVANPARARDRALYADMSAPRAGGHPLPFPQLTFWKYSRGIAQCAGSALDERPYHRTLAFRRR